MGLHDVTVYDMACQNALHYPNLTAFVDDQRRITYSEFLILVDRLSAGLTKQGLNFHDRLGVIARNSLEFFALYFAAAKIGSVVVPVNYRLSETELEYILRDTRPKLLFVDENYEKIILGFIQTMPFVKGIFCLGRNNAAFMGIDSLEDRTSHEEQNVSSDDDFIILHTAAVDGKPRGAVLSHSNIFAHSVGAQCKLALNNCDVYLNLLALFHAANVYMALSIFHAAGTNVILPRFDPDMALSWIEKERASILFTFPPMLANILDRLETSSSDISSLRVVVGHERPETVDRLQRLTNSKFWTVYGQTETSSWVTTAPFVGQGGNVGRPSPLVKMKLTDDKGQEVEKGSVGEILIKGPHVFKGYWNLDKETSYTFRGGWHHTGDMGLLDAEGCLWYAGRKDEKDLIKSGGENVYPYEVEKVILEHPQVEKVVIIGVPDPKWGEGIKAVCVKKKDSQLSPEELMEFVAKRIARYKKPQYVEFVSVLPEMSNGQIDRAAVKSKYGARG